MKILLIGGAGNGKSFYAEQLALQFPGPHYYLAAMDPCAHGEEELPTLAGIKELHSQQGFMTIECCRNLAELRLPSRGTVLLECLCHLLDNEMFDETGTVRDAVPNILRGLEVLGQQCDNLLVVTNDVGSDVTDYPESTIQYMDEIGRLNRKAAECMDAVLEVAAGIPILRKGRLLLMDKLISPGFIKERGTDMILIIGAEASGKRTYVKELGYTDSEIASAVLDERPVLCDLQEMVARDPENCESMLPELLRKQVIVCNEVGSGVIPADPVGRFTRRQTGKMCILLAQHAKRVIRMVCGIPTVLKSV